MVQFAEVDEFLAAEHMRDEIERIELGRHGEAAQRRVRIGAAIVQIAEEAVTGGVVGIRLGRPLQQWQGLVELELLGEQPALHRECIRQVRAERERAVDERFGLGRHVLERRAVQRQAVEQGLGETHLRQRVLRIGGHGAPEEFRRLEVVVGGALALARATQQVQLVRLHLLRLALGPLLGGIGGQRQVQLLGHRTRDRVLDQENVPERHVVGVRPDVQAMSRLDELHGDAHLVTRTSQGAFQHMGGAELPADFAHVGVGALERERRSARHHAQRGDMRQPVGELFREAVA